MYVNSCRYRSGCKRQCARSGEGVDWHDPSRPGTLCVRCPSLEVERKPRAAGRTGAFDPGGLLIPVQRQALKCNPCRAHCSLRVGALVLLMMEPELRKRCTTSSHRSIAQWEHEHILEDGQRRLDETPQAMRIRRETVEHPFGTIKARMGATHFLMKRLKNLKTEWRSRCSPTI
jgi:hypothetical protein